MTPSNETMLSFYQQLGRIFYGIADADGAVRLDEIKKLDSIVKEYWLPLESTFDEFDTDSAYQIEIVFSWLHENDWHEGNTLKEFGEYMQEHPKLFTEKNRQLIYDTAENIAESFHGFNKKETTYLHHLSEMLKY
ncbi:hypothetical protein SAMN06298216_2593 [Spirosomataceae bacterium TFI 002]|nr:hypothetical protein SAMN06298216_2593 [Spirosomataceae bacterium TFI 002]